MTRWYRLSLICGFTPLILGIVTFISWVVTGADWLQLAGILNIILGLALFACGVLFLGVYYLKARNQGNKEYLKKTALSLAVLVANFPAAAAALYSASYIIGTSTVVVVNNTAHDITDLVLSEREIIYKYPDIRAKQEIEQKFHFMYEGEVNYRFILDGVVLEGIMFGYVSAGRGVDAVMVVSEDGGVKIENRL